MPISLKTYLNALTKVGKITSSRLEILGLKTVEDLLFYFPYRYDDYSNVVKIKDLQPEIPVTIKGRIVSISTFTTRYQRKKITQALVSDSTGSIKIIWFNRAYILTQLKQGDDVSISGKAEFDGKSFVMKNPDYERGDARVHTGRIVPIYSLTAGLTQKQVRFLVSQAMGAVDEVKEWLLQEIKNQKSKIKDNYQLLITNLLDLQTALRQIHFPDNNQLLARARYRLKFDEMFLLQLRKAITRAQIKKSKAPQLSFKEKEIKKFVKSLPFALTDAQRKSAWKILQDCGKEVPMNRLLQGDVGSGKTVVAVIAMFNAVLNGFQAVLMAPTEILAKQHYKTVCSLLKEFDVTVGLITRSAKEIKNQKSKIKDIIQKSKIIIGTHALIQDKIQLRNLGLAIVDEQHRFGVEQRKKLKNQKSKLSSRKFSGQETATQNLKSPHFLSITATPIPRSLSLTVYGSLDISVLNEMPKGRKPINTKVVHQKDRQKSYNFINSQIALGRQVFVICPLIDESDKLGVKAVTTEYEKLDKEVFPDLRIGLLHGKLKSKEKDDVQEKFVKREYDILVSTSVVEVGVDVPNASVMIIEGAERFGLAQLHQFRGRVGRSKHQSYCFLFTNSRNPATFERLDFIAGTTDGFKIAEFDLKLRGAGNVYGKEQSGFPEFRIASLDDIELIELTQNLARDLIGLDSELHQFPSIKQKIAEVGGVVHLE